MALDRPQHLRLRTVGGRAISVEAVLIRSGAGTRSTDPDNPGVWTPGPVTRVNIKCTTKPDTGEMRDYDLAGARLTGGRVFKVDGALDIAALRTGVSASEGDQIEYDGQRYRVVGVQPWLGQKVVHTVLVEPQ